MSKRRLKKPAKLPDCGDRLRKALAKRTKNDLIDTLVELAREDRNILRRLSERFELEAPPEELVVATRRAIADATDFDERDINHNFDYDDAAYERSETQSEPLGRSGATSAGDGAFAGVDETRKLSGRNER